MLLIEKIVYFLSPFAPIFLLVVVVCGVLYRVVISPPCIYPPGPKADFAQYWILQEMHSTLLLLHKTSEPQSGLEIYLVSAKCFLLFSMCYFNRQLLCRGDTSISPLCPPVAAVSLLLKLLQPKVQIYFHIYFCWS